MNICRLLSGNTKIMCIRCRWECQMDCSQHKSPHQARASMVINMIRYRCSFIVWYKIWRPITKLYILTPWSLDVFIRVPHNSTESIQSCSHFGAFNLSHCHLYPTGTHFHLSQVKHLRVKCLAKEHPIETVSQNWEGRNMIFLWKYCTKLGSKTAWQAATSAKRRALIIAPYPSLTISKYLQLKKKKKKLYLTIIV